MTTSNRSYEPSREEIAKGVLEGWCVRHNVATMPAEDGWIRCPRSIGIARAYTTDSEVVVEIKDVFGDHIIRLAVPTRGAA